MPGPGNINGSHWEPFFYTTLNYCIALWLSHLSLQTQNLMAALGLDYRGDKLRSSLDVAAQKKKIGRAHV